MILSDENACLLRRAAMDSEKRYLVARAGGSGRRARAMPWSYTLLVEVKTSDGYPGQAATW